MNQRSINFGRQRRAKFGSYLKDLLKKQWRKQKEAAAELGISEEKLSHIVTGKRPAPDHILIMITEKCEVPLEELLRKKYSPQLPLLDGVMQPAELMRDLQKDLHPEDVEELTRYIAFLLLRRATANRS